MTERGPSSRENSSREGLREHAPTGCRETDGQAESEVSGGAESAAVCSRGQATMTVTVQLGLKVVA